MDISWGRLFASRSLPVPNFWDNLRGIFRSLGDQMGGGGGGGGSKGVKNC